MEFDIGTLIYIIITIIAIAAGTLGKKKRPAVQKSEGDQEFTTSGIFDKLGREFEGFIAEAKGSVSSFTEQLMEEDNSAAPETAVQENYRGYESLLDKYKDGIPADAGFFGEDEGLYDPNEEEVEELMSTEGISATAGQVLDVVEIDDTTHADYLQIIRDFNLASAVIYSTIFYRKEY